MADLKFDVDSSEVSRAVDELIRMGKASKDTAKAFEQGFRKVVSWQERFQSEQGRINATLEKNYRAQTLSNKSAKESAAVFQQLEAQVSKAATSYSQLKASIDPVYAAQLRMKKGHEAVRAALKAGIITRAEAAQSLRAYRTEVQSLSQAQMAATKASNRFGVVTQQAGYQIGDFLVQVQSGTSPFVAFGQQATQLVGILPLMTGAFGLSTTALIGLSAGLGIAIPLVTAIGAALFKMSKKADKSSDSTKKFEDSLRSARDEVQGMKDDLELLQSGFKNAFELTLTKSIDQANANLKEAKKNLEEATSAMALYGMGAAGGISLSTFGIGKSPDEVLADAQEAVRLAVVELATAKELSRQEQQRARDASVVNQLQEARVILREKEAKAQEEQAEAQAESESRLSRISLIMSEIRKETEDAALAASDFAQKLAAIAAMGPEQSKFEARVSSGILPPQAAGDFGISGGDTPYELQQYLDAVSKRVKAREEADKSSKVTAAKADPLETLRSQLQLETELLGKTEEYARVRQALGDTYDDVEPKVISRLEQQIVLINEAKQAEEERKSLMQTVESSLESGFMSMIDGTKSVKDAFKDMARQIIAELMRVLVVKKAVSAATGFFGFADGGVFSGGSQVKAFADGGVVGGPTTFPMAGGQTGLMGEAGPEAIMPLKRGANGKLGVQVEGGTQGNVVVNQSFNFSANGDDSVKKLIAQAAPQIASMTQKQILDSRRRGGAMKSTFG